MQEYRSLDGDRGYRYLASQHDSDSSHAAQKWTIFSLALASAVYLFVSHFDLFILSPLDLLWNALVFFLPTSLINLLARIARTEGVGVAPSAAANNGSEIHAMKSQALRRLLGVDGGTLAPRTLGSSPSLARRTKNLSVTPAGLGNWDNSCYQNSILQGLSALPSFKGFLMSRSAFLKDNSTTGTLHALTQHLMAEENNGKHIWTPAKLKSMSSWQQQDAQEYFSRILDDMEKEAKQQATQQIDTLGLEQVQGLDTERHTPNASPLHGVQNPLEGLLAQRVACIDCGFSEGLTLLPFNCLTVSLGHDRQYTLQDRLHDYTKLEDIEGVECISCTLRRQESRLQTLVAKSTLCKDDNTEGVHLKQSPELSTMVATRLAEVRARIKGRDYTDQALKKCAVASDGKVTTTKTKQVVVARAPRSLAIHVNRSIFDDMTGTLHKNPAFVSYPKHLRLDAWTIGRRAVDSENAEVWSMDPRASMVSKGRSMTGGGQLDYVLKSVVTHHGRHENGHYVCFRQHDNRQDDETILKNGSESETTNGTQSPFHEQWWRLSDEDVTRVTEEEVLGQSGVFMLFYERKGPKDRIDAEVRDESEMDEASEAVAQGEVELALLESDPSTISNEASTIFIEDVSSQEVHAATKSRLESGISGKVGTGSPNASQPEEQPTAPPPRQTFQPPKLRTANNQSLRDSTNFSHIMRDVAAQ